MAPNVSPSPTLPLHPLNLYMQSTIPAGYKFLNLETFMSNKAYEMLEDLMSRAANRNPDAFDMYIYNGQYINGSSSVIPPSSCDVKTFTRTLYWIWWTNSSAPLILKS